LNPKIPKIFLEFFKPVLGHFSKQGFFAKIFTLNI